MKGIEEEYVSFETAKLLKEKGFDDVCRAFIAAPSQSVVMKWLREVHNKHIQVGYDIQLSWYYDIIDLKETVSYDYEEMKCWHNEFNFNNYKETVESAINYCLENLT